MSEIGSKGDDPQKRADMFYLEEFKALRTEIDDRITEGGKLLQLALVGVGAVYSWLAEKGSDDKHILIIGLAAAVLISAVSTFRVYFLNKLVLKLGDHISETEKRFGADRAWETSLRSDDKHLAKNRETHSKPWSGELFALGLLTIGTIAILILWIYFWH
jgi:hypothetical protein